LLKKFLQLIKQVLSTKEPSAATDKKTVSPPTAEKKKAQHTQPKTKPKKKKPTPQ